MVPQCEPKNEHGTRGKRTGIEPVLLAFLALSKVGSMDAHVEDVGILVANVLNAIAVMHIGIKDQNTLGRSRVNGVFGCLLKVDGEKPRTDIRIKRTTAQLLK